MSLVANIHLQNYRSYKNESFEFEPGVNIIVGPNGSGKTNLLEALLMTAKGSSYRGRDAQLVRFGAEWARIDVGDVEGLTRTVKLQQLPDAIIQKTFEVDGKVMKRMTAHKQVPTVVFEPNHLQMVHAEPQLRRDYIDDLAAHLDVRSTKYLQDFKRILAQRNSLLKRRAPQDQYFVWDIQLCQVAELVVRSRVNALNTVNKALTKTYKELGGKVKKLRVEYKSTTPFNDQYADVLLRQLHHNHAKELDRGFTIFGPHRDDLVFLFDEIDARIRASRGEVRTIVLAMKIIELGVFDAQKPPLLLLDDVFSELDGSRRRALAERLKEYQTFITTTDADVVLEHFQNNATIIAM